MDKKVTKADYIKDIRKYLNALNVRKGDSLELNKLVSHQKVTIGDKVLDNEIYVKKVSPDSISIEWYTNGKLCDYSGDYRYNDKNVNYGVVMNVASILYGYLN